MMEHTCAGMYDVTCEACNVLHDLPVTDEERDGELDEIDLEHYLDTIGG